MLCLLILLFLIQLFVFMVYESNDDLVRIEFTLRKVNYYEIIGYNNELVSLCDIIKNLTSPSLPTSLVVDMHRGGIGHKTWSTAMEILYAVVLHKQLWCILYDPILYS
jgi:hypothetical protein